MRTSLRITLMEVFYVALLCFIIIQFSTSLKHAFPKICPWFPCKISVKTSYLRWLENKCYWVLSYGLILSYIASIEKVDPQAKLPPQTQGNHSAKTLDEMKDLLGWLALPNALPPMKKEFRKLTGTWYSCGIIF